MTNAEASIAENRRRYEALKAAGQSDAPRALPPPSSLPAPTIHDDDVLHREQVPGGWYWSTTVRRGDALRLELSKGPATIALVAWSLADPSERLNYADTVKVQWTAALGKGRVIFSDMGRVMFSMIEDSTGYHDALVGGCTAASTAARYGASQRNTRDNFILAAAKLGLSRRDIPPCLSFFAPVRTDAHGQLTWVEGKRRAGDFVDLRAEMDLIVALSNSPHPLDPAVVYDPKPVTITRFRAAPASVDDLCRTASAEAKRGFENTDALAI
jgi:urea carboxylase-associated protein 2